MSASCDPGMGRGSVRPHPRSMQHLWTPPSGQGKTSGTPWRVVGCCHLSGLLRGHGPPACMGVRGSGPHQTGVLKVRWRELVFPIPSHRLLRHALLALALRLGGCRPWRTYAATVGALYVPPL